MLPRLILADAILEEMRKLAAGLGKISADVGKVLLAQHEAAASDETSFMSLTGQSLRRAGGHQD